MYQFTEKWVCRGLTVWPGVCLKEPFIINEEKQTLSKPGSETLKDIPLSILTEFYFELPKTKKRTKK